MGFAGSPGGAHCAIHHRRHQRHCRGPSVLIMTVPPMLVGAWRRSGLIIDGKRAVDHCDVIFLHTPECFIDIRLRLDPTSTPPPDGLGAKFATEVAFAGIGIWDGSLMT